MGAKPLGVAADVQMLSLLEEAADASSPKEVALIVRLVANEEGRLIIAIDSTGGGGFS
jgi:hypothetical protein